MKNGVVRESARFRIVYTPSFLGFIYHAVLQTRDRRDPQYLVLIYWPVPALVVLATLFLGDLITVRSRSCQLLSERSHRQGPNRWGVRRRVISHVVGQALQMCLLLGELLLQVQQLLLLALLDGIIFERMPALLEGVSAMRGNG